ncbi:hydrogenase-4 component G [Aliarcobacter cryaerophilus]|uniref:Hydrogenase-4 component G n=1 Tax=Aliarcobacter cryaerophilus TaxID=28198 RepID=A0A7G9LKY6_9BACT|nr:hydrogenase-4 component G [Aliarcobacter cryaerophilus]QNM89285.1 hydrogenase-4 component G [Aliarcobacter cryaerophilus]
MQIQNSTNQALNAFKQNSTSKVDEGSKEQVAPKTEKSVEEIINNSAAKVAISMNAQYILFEMNAKAMAAGNSVGQSGLNASKDQQSVLDFLSGKGKINDMSLEDIGYKGKPIMDLSPQEATDLVGENGFFGITQTSDRVSNFVFSFAGDDLEKLQKGRDGIVKGFEEANKMFGGNLPEISYKTQERTLALIDAKIESLKNPQAKVEE